MQFITYLKQSYLLSTSIDLYLLYTYDSHLYFSVTHKHWCANSIDVAVLSLCLYVSLSLCRCISVAFRYRIETV